MRALSLRLTLLLVAAFAGVLLVPALSLRAWLKDEREKAMAVDARLRLRILLERVQRLRDAGVEDVARDLDPLLLALGAEGEVRGADGNRIYATRGFSTSDPERVAATEGGGGFTATIAMSRKPLERPAEQMWLMAAVVVPLLLLLAGGLCLLLLRGALAPVEEIRRQAERISRENLSERVPEDVLRGEFRDLARTFNEMLGRIDRAMEDLRSFAADAAHELRAPLANLRAELEATAQRAPSAEEDRKTLASVAEEVARMSRVVADLLTLARMDLKQHALSRERVEVPPLLEEAREVWAPLARERGITISVDASEVAPVVGDPGALRRVFFNLLHNAVKYNRPGGAVEVRTYAASDALEIHVKDTGMGIAAEHLPRLFRRFYRVDQARSRDSGGSGLGLALCKSFVEAHGGAIRVASEPGKGSTFIVRLPRIPSVAPDPVVH